MSKFSKVISVALSIIAVQFIIAFATIMFLPTFGFMLESNTGMKVYSSITAIIFLYAAYSRVWEAGRKDAKHVKIYNNHNEDKIAIDIKKGLIIGFVAAIPSLIALTVLIISKYTGSFDIVNVVYRIVQSTFLGWLGNDNLTYIPNCVIVTIIPVIVCIPAYITGTKEFSLAEKYLPEIIYKKPEKKKNKKEK